MADYSLTTTAATASLTASAALLYRSPRSWSSSANPLFDGDLTVTIGGTAYPGGTNGTNTNVTGRESRTCTG
jgi:hypothetical protein